MNFEILLRLLPDFEIRCFTIKFGTLLNQILKYGSPLKRILKFGAFLKMVCKHPNPVLS